MFLDKKQQNFLERDQFLDFLEKDLGIVSLPIGQMDKLFNYYDFKSRDRISYEEFFEIFCSRQTEFRNLVARRNSNL